MIKTSLLVKKKERAITIHDIESCTELEFAKTDRAQGEWPGVALLQMVGSVHDAAEKYAVCQ